ncbi:MAG: tRNA (adenine-N1)-methyltransferase [Nitrososphaerales archaeon]|nr:tRNA (adenine-N1)-methyltransferase [Nitrososphaerales archaeon]|tara:strand:- start:1130 stop:1918 length:789 start_codon:yes stop_codon:yes gene_type:complete
MKDNLVKENDFVLFYLSPRKKWLIQVSPGKQVHTHAGYIEVEEVIGKEYGQSVMTNTNQEIYLLYPRLNDFIFKSKRATQILYPKDMAIIASWTDLSNGKKVVEAGTGSGSLSCFIANLIRPEGRLYTYDVREESHEIAKKNIEKAGLSEFVTLKIKDAKLGLEEKDMDVAILDLGDPWTLIKTMKGCLRPGGILASVSPTINQVEKVVIELQNEGFLEIETLEILMREMEVREGKTRPAMRMVGHTTYLTFARKSLDTVKG